MKKLLTLVVTIMTIAMIGTYVSAANQDIGYYISYGFDIGQSVIFPTTRTLYLPGSSAVNNNISISNSFFYTSAYNEASTQRVTASVALYSGNRVTMNYVNSQYENDVGAHYRLCMSNQSSYGNVASGSWAPNLSDR